MTTKPHSTVQEFDLGPIAEFPSLPAQVKIDDKKFFLVRENSQYRLLSTICPHMGGPIADHGTRFECPRHGWCFRRDNGQGINNSQRMASMPVKVRDGHLIALHAPGALSFNENAFNARDAMSISIQLLAQACLHIKHRGFSLLTDPWLDGPAFLGAWMQYPPYPVDLSSLNPDAIFISHEHSDHFHEPTLIQMERRVPIYVPDFPNRRLVTRLRELGFTDVHPMAFGKPCALGEGVRITCFEPTSYWNDAIVLVELEEFRILNLNDAGLNHRIASHVKPVDVVAASFSPGASGYPLTWMHLTKEEKIQIQRRSCRGMLEMLEQALILYDGQTLLPFASHFTLWHPAHDEYIRLTKKNTIFDVVRFCRERQLSVIDLLPGETWEPSSGRIDRYWKDREGLYQRDHIQRAIQRQRRKTGQQKYPTVAPGTVTPAKASNYFLTLNDVPEILFCEDLTATVNVTDPGCERLLFQLHIRIQQGRLAVQTEAHAAPNVRIDVTQGILAHLIKNNVSWDEATIGYWCRFSRAPDVYHAGFWRLLQAPYYKQQMEFPGGSKTPITPDSIVAELIERHGEAADRILRRYGMYCAGCQHSTSESLALAAKHHGIDQNRTERLVAELDRALLSEP